MSAQAVVHNSDDDNPQLVARLVYINTQVVKSQEFHLAEAKERLLRFGPGTYEINHRGGKVQVTQETLRIPTGEIKPVFDPAAFNDLPAELRHACVHAGVVTYEPVVEGGSSPQVRVTIR